MNRRAVIAAMLVMAFITAPAPAEVPQQAFQRIYGPLIKGLNTSQKKVEFARRLLRDSDALRDDRALAEVLLAKSYEYSWTIPDGYPIAEAAARGLGRLDPAKKDVADEMLLSLFERRFRTAAGPQRAAEAGA